MIDQNELSPNTLKDNTISSLEYSVRKSIQGPTIQYDILGNHFEEVTLSMVSISLDFLNMRGNKFTRTDMTFDALSVSQMQRFVILVADSNFENYNGKGISFRDAIHSKIYIDHVK